MKKKPAFYLLGLAAAGAGAAGGMAAVGDTPVLYTEAEKLQELWDADTPEKLSRIQQYLLAHP